jgi:negative regulator of flagellin synthesis FlgM
MKIETDTPAAQAPSKAASAPAPASAADQVTLSKAANTRLPASLASGPPFDMDTVQRIKQAITDGNYPINHDRIADNLFESYRDLTS